MIQRLQQITILLLMLSIQLQPVITEATIFTETHASDYSGTHDHSHHAGSADQASECHPVHALSPPLNYEFSTALPFPYTSVALVEKALSIDLIRDPPPPRHFVS
ncbi:hypothetical protein [Amphritea balenae]|uniref:Uncharacterized protein n=1 Tax=Amphritea balenae TaxID=452629 RepID=A0A3P1SX32_9GAMM|nr:hypothetical protein [Amphritea balenae]RRD01700.1 hypothetical protein EHS89_03865 [Amphritea balenae]GGK54910.1 hypothetical protein GCM10007941_01140 [Amphritea balenae]